MSQARRALGPKPITINSTVLYPPQRGEYQILCGQDVLPGGKTRIRIIGNAISDYLSFDLASFCYGKKCWGIDQVGQLRGGEYTFVTKDSLPMYLQEQDLPPIMVLSAKYPGVLGGVPLLYVNLGSAVSYKVAIVKVGQLRVCNPEIKAEYQALLKPTPVTTGLHPIFEEKARPTPHFLFNLFKQFKAYNNREKVKDQFQQTHLRCHIRAHFVAMLLGQYGIPSEKIIKFWDLDAWKKTGVNCNYVHHVGTVIRDDRNSKWVWDPWEAEPESLTPLKKWVYRNNEPEPIQVRITNSMCVSVRGDLFHSAYADGANFTRSPYTDVRYFRSFQFLCSSALPPAKPLRQPNLFGFFAEEKELEENRQISMLAQPSIAKRLERK